MNRFESLLKNAQTLTFTFQSKTNAPDGKTHTFHGFAEKPNKFRMEEIVNGKRIALVISNGQAVYAYQVSTRHYQRKTALKTYGDVNEENIRNQTTGWLGDSFLPILMFFSGEPDLADFRQYNNLGKVSYSSSAIMLDEAGITRITESVTVARPLSFSPLGFEYNFDTRTGLLHEIRVGFMEPPLNQFDYLFSFSFSIFRLGASPLPASIFTWTLPYGSVLDIPSH